MFLDYPDILSVEEVCDILSIGRNRTYEYLKSGALSGFRVGRTWRIPKKNLQTFVMRRCRLAN